MQYCSRCQVKIINPSTRCPLCHGALEGEAKPEGRMFPDTQRVRSRVLMGFKIFSFLCVAAIVVSLCLNFLIPVDVFWAGFVAAAVGCTWLLTAVALRKRRNLLKSSLWEMVLLWGSFLLWDFLTGFDGWSLDYGIPVVVLVVYGFLLLVVCLTRMPPSYYMIYFLMAGLAGMAPLIFLALGLLSMRLPSVLCAGVSVLILVGLCVFQGKAVREEIQKKMHLGSR